MTDQTQVSEAPVEKSMAELKQELVSLGMPEVDVQAFNVKSQVRAVINTLQTKKAVEKVDSLEDKETPSEKKQTEKQWRTKAEIMRAKLMAQPKIRTTLPLQASEKPGVVEWRTDKNGHKYQFVVSGSYETVQLNGFKYFIPKGVPTNIPEQVSEVLDDSYLRTQAAGKDISMDRIDERTGRPVSEAL